jgi:hypothetical protein
MIEPTKLIIHEIYQKKLMDFRHRYFGSKSSTVLIVGIYSDEAA